ncbi:MAG TPA: MBL fold metallo-hydrolase [Candidatus Limnocylindria bacterium]
MATSGGDRAERQLTASDRGTIGYLGHATVVIDLAGVQVITDPILTGRVSFIRRIASAPAPAPAQASSGLILISHGHMDHLHRASLQKLGLEVPVVVPIGLGRLVEGWGHRSVTELAIGASYAHGPVTVTAVRADHSGFRPPLGPHAESVGYVIEGGGRAIYFAGDTDLYADMAELAERSLDVALIPVWGWGPTLGAGHLDPERAATAVGLLAPRVAIPIHWGTLWPMAMPWRRRQLVDPPELFAEAVARVAPQTRVVVLAPGASLSLGEAA